MNPKTPGICDRCGFRCLLTRMRFLTIGDRPTKIRVCPTCYEADHPQLKPYRGRVDDPRPVPDARPDFSTGRGQFGWNPVGYLNTYGGSATVLTLTLGEVTVA